MLDKYVYRNLERYGNCVIGLQDLKKYGKKKILNDLLQHGFNCSIRVLGKEKEVSTYVHFGKFDEANVIVEVIK